MDEFVPESAIDYDEVFRRGGRNCGDEDFALFKCPRCDQVYLMEYEVDTVYLNGKDLSLRANVVSESFDCTNCHQTVPDDVPWVGPKASTRFQVTWEELATSDWAWAVPR